MAYDRMDWHYGGEYPAGLPPENGGTHIGMYLVWLIERGLMSTEHLDESSAELQAVRERRMTGRDFLIEVCDEKFWAADLNLEGQAFTAEYYEADTPFGKAHGAYMQDYCDVFNAHATENGFEYESTYHVENTWDNYERLRPMLDRRWVEWQTWSAQPERAMDDPRARFAAACATLGEFLTIHGFKPNKHGVVWKRVCTDKDTTLRIEFQPESYNRVGDVKLSVHTSAASRKLQKWMKEETKNPHEDGQFFSAFLNDANYPRQVENWQLAGSDFDNSLQRIRSLLETQTLQMFALFEDRERVLVHLSTAGGRFHAGHEIRALPLALALCSGTRAQAQSFFEHYLSSLPKPWRGNVKKLWHELEAQGVKDLNLNEFFEASYIKLGFKHGLTLPAS